jgi:LysR family transcriptional regulator for bpeEF and oprC
MAMHDYWRYLPAFIKTAEAGSFVGAGRQMGLTASAVGKAVAALEAELAVPLLVRSTRAMRLTPEGQDFYQRCRQAADVLAEAHDDATARSDSARGRLRVNIHSNLGRIRVLPALSGFLQRYPGITLDVSLTSAALDLLNHEVDVVVRILQPPDSTVIGRHIGNLQFVTCASPLYLRRNGKPEHPADLGAHNCLRYVLPERALYDQWHFERDGEQLDIKVSGNLCIDDGHSLADNAVNGLGVVHLINTTVEGHIAAGRLAPLLTDWHAPGPPIYVMYRRSARQPAKLTAFVEWITQLFAAEAPTRPAAGRTRRVRGRA